MKRKGVKYQIGDRWYMKRSFKSLHENWEVTIVNVYKKGRRKFIDGRDINNVVITDISVKMLRKHPR